MHSAGWVLGGEGACCRRLGLTPRIPETKVWAGLRGRCQAPAVREAPSDGLRGSAVPRQTPVLILALSHSGWMACEPQSPCLENGQEGLLCRAGRAGASVCTAPGHGQRGTFADRQCSLDLRKVQR